MEAKDKPSIVQIVRGLHRDIGFTIVGLTVLFALSGIVQIYRDLGFMERATRVETTLAPGMAASELGQALRVREFRVLRTEGAVTYFTGGSYDSATGRVVRTEKRYPFPLDRFSALHKAPSKFAVHWLTTIYGVLLLFMALSSFWMFRSTSSHLRRGLAFAAGGVVLALVMLFLSPGA
jgi:uncharacterized protein